SNFLANLSHELLTPMNGILGLTELLSQTSLNFEQQELACDIQESGRRLFGLIQGVLKFDTIESGKLKIQSLPFDVRALCQSVLETYLPKALAKGQELKSVLDESLPPEIQGDSEQIRQVLCMLLENAIKFTQKGVVTLRVQAVRDNSSAVEFSVVDTGPGIEAHQVEV